MILASISFVFLRKPAALLADRKSIKICLSFFEKSGKCEEKKKIQKKFPQRILQIDAIVL